MRRFSFSTTEFAPEEKAGWYKVRTLVLEGESVEVAYEKAEKELSPGHRIWCWWEVEESSHRPMDRAQVS